MGIYLNPGNAGFASAVNSEIYVDKTGMLEYTSRVIGTEQRWICVSRPRRFGKSIAAEMLAAYYGKSCDSSDLFCNLDISKASDYRKHLNQYDVVHLDIAWFYRPGENAMDLVRRISTDVVAELREFYPGVIADSENYLPQALAILNKAVGVSFIIIINEWDIIFRDNRDDIKTQEAYVNLLQDLFKGETSRQFVKLAYLTGILPIKKYNGESVLNNFDEFTMTSPGCLAEYVGFTEKEVRQLCEQYDKDF